MSYKYVVAVVRPDVIAPLEARLAQIGVGGITLTRVKGFGETKSFFAGDGVTEHTKLEVFVEESELEAVLAVLRETAFPGVPGAGVAAVMPVDTFEHLRVVGSSPPGAAP